VPLKSFIRDVEGKVFDLSSSLEEFRNSLKWGKLWLVSMI
jgi:hypothetical protein